MEIKIAVPSYKRPSRVEVLRYLPSATVYVSTDELAEYKKNYPQAKIVGVEPQYQGNVCRIRNRILALNPNDAVLIVDDDLQYLGYWEQKMIWRLDTESQVYGMLAKYTALALDWGVRLWGINIAPDPQNYREMLPFSTVVYVGSPFMVHLPPHEILFDERFSLKEDYDFTLQHLNRFRKILRVNKYFYEVRQAEQAGGVATYRNLEREKEQFLLLQKKWGRDIVRSDSLVRSRSHKNDKRRVIDINPIIHPPIPGV